MNISYCLVSLCKPQRDPCVVCDKSQLLGFACSAKGFDPQNFDYAQDDTQNFFVRFCSINLILTYPFPKRKRRWCLAIVFEFRCALFALTPSREGRSLQAPTGEVGEASKPARASAPNRVPFCLCKARSSDPFARGANRGRRAQLSRPFQAP